MKQHQRDAAAQTVKPTAQTLYESSASSEAAPADAFATDWRAFTDEIVAVVADAGMSEDVDIEVMSSEILISFKDAIPFTSGKADLMAEALPILEQIAVLAVNRPAMYLRVNGHTDDRPISTAEFPSNWELSSARASRVARYLIEKGVHPTRIG
ncbi:MAG: OmpA/MotB family protein, partial [Candidatus Binatia bacterium]